MEPDSNLESLGDGVSTRAERAGLTGAMKQLAGDMTTLRALGIDQVFWWSMDTEPGEQMDLIAHVQAMIGR